MPSGGGASMWLADPRAGDRAARTRTRRSAGADEGPEGGTGMAGTARATDESKAADVLVIFGITGDLAKVMTFRL